MKERNGIKYGWLAHGEIGDVTIADPAFWTASALAVALGKRGLIEGEARVHYRTRLFYTQDILKIYRPTNFEGGWSRFPLQGDSSQPDAYSTTLALRALLDTRRAGLPWEGSRQRRDELLEATAGWLVRHFEHSPPGWRQYSRDARPSESLTLQVYAALLRAENEKGFKVPDEIIEQIPHHLMRYSLPSEASDQRGASTSRPFITHDGREEVQTTEFVMFLWYPWAIDCSVRWLEGAGYRRASPENITRVRRGLGYLLVDLRNDAISNENLAETYIGAETLYINP